MVNICCVSPHEQRLLDKIEGKDMFNILYSYIN